MMTIERKSLSTYGTGPSLPVAVETQTCVVCRYGRQACHHDGEARTHQPLCLHSIHENNSDHQDLVSLEMNERNTQWNLV